MNKTIEKISKFEAVALFVTLTTNEIIFNIPQAIISSVGSSAWINGLYVILLATIFCFIFSKLFKPFICLDLIDISKYLGGNILKTIVGVLYIAFFVLMISFTTKYFCDFLQSIYFYSTPIAFLIFIFLLAPFVCNLLGLKSISSINLIIMPIVLVTTISLFVFSANEFTFNRLFPILGNGVDATFLTGSTNIFAFTCFAYLYFLRPVLKKDEDFKAITWISLIISWIYLFFSVVSLLLTFSFVITSDNIMSLYLLARMLDFGQFFQRVDAIFLFLWVVSNLSFLSFTLYFITQIFKKITGISHQKQSIYIIIPIVFAIALFIPDLAQIKFFSRFIYKYSTCLLVFVISPIILLLAYLKQKKGRKKVL